MQDRIKQRDPNVERRAIVVSAAPDIAERLKNDLEQIGYKISIITDHGKQVSSPESKVILKLATEDDADLRVLRQQRDEVSVIFEEETSQVTRARDKLQGDYREIIGKSPQIFEVLQHIENLADTPLRVLISGETGTGKEIVARAIHKNSGRMGKMVAVNCASIPENLLESELFGHERGAFTSANTRHIGKFERAHNGTLFLDEIGEMPLSMQPKLLRVIENNEIERVGGEKPIPVNVRIVAATNRDLVQAVKDKTFREDLYYRLNVASISLPTLSERQEDIYALVVHFLKKHYLSCELEIPQVAPNTLVLLKSYSWPGNIRELENTIQTASYAAKGGILLPEHLPENIRMYQKRPVSISGGMSTLEDEQKVSVPLGTTLEVMEEAYIRETLVRFDGNRTKTAQVLEIGIRTLQRKLKKYDV